MRTITRLGLGAAAMTLIGLGAASSLALQPDDDALLAPPAMPDLSKLSKREIAEMMEASGRPTAAHDRLAFMVGKSEIDVKMTMPGVPELTAKAIGEGEWALGKRFVITRSKPAPGEEMRTESMNIFGYDTRKNEYFWIGLDTLGTYFVASYGQFDEATRTFTLIGEETHEGIGKVRHRMLITDNGDGTSTSAIEFELVPGSKQWSRMAELKTRMIK